ncbi:hypothetical protein GCM10008019_39340 [Deinococcus soli (ex Cha et al. 2016)]|nr:hypothetical protein GCM10008019_39340 [Deinococcus soli (ex Cha et al. 2016)]
MIGLLRRAGLQGRQEVPGKRVQRDVHRVVRTPLEVHGRPLPPRLGVQIMRDGEALTAEQERRHTHLLNDPAHAVRLGGLQREENAAVTSEEMYGIWRRRA